MMRILQSIRGVSLTGLLLAFATTAVAEEPTPLFNEQSLDNWMTLEGEPVGDGWEVVDGVIHLRKEKRKYRHIVTRETYGDFTLTFDWKIAAGGNSGVKYRVCRYDGKALGCEYQVYDDVGTHRSLAARKSAGSLYDLYAPNLDKQLKPAGEFNAAKIVVRGDRIEHWLNGRRVVSAVVGSNDWHLRIAASKFSDDYQFGENRRGRIMLTDHGSEVWYRNLSLAPFADGE